MVVVFQFLVSMLLNIAPLRSMPHGNEVDDIPYLSSFRFPREILVHKILPLRKDKN